MNPATPASENARTNGPEGWWAVSAVTESSGPSGDRDASEDHDEQVPEQRCVESEAPVALQPTAMTVRPLSDRHVGPDCHCIPPSRCWEMSVVTTVASANHAATTTGSTERQPPVRWIPPATRVDAPIRSDTTRRSLGDPGRGRSDRRGRTLRGLRAGNPPPVCACLELTGLAGTVARTAAVTTKRGPLTAVPVAGKGVVPGAGFEPALHVNGRGV